MRSAQFISLLIFAPLLSFSQQLSVQVVAGSDSLQVNWVDVYIEDSNGVQTALQSFEENGLYRAIVSKSGYYTLVVFKRGYASQSHTIKIPAAEDLEKIIHLKPLNFNLDYVEIAATREGVAGRRTMRTVEGTAIYSGKKSEVIIPAEILANKAANKARQTYAKIAGINVWESDGGGLQLGIGGRGLSPDRTANFNVRQDGYDISADALGYPEAYYTPPVEAIERIEIVRGAASLQYGTQFGGLLNFVLKEAPRNEWDLTIRQSAGAWSFYSTLISGGYGGEKASAYGFFQYKRGDGWRPFSEFDQRTGHLKSSFQLADDHRLSLALTHMNYLARQPGGLTDAAFDQDPQQALRERNWFQVDWNIGYLGYEWKVSSKSLFELRSFGLLARKDALGNLQPPNRLDPGGNRDLLADRFKNFGSEARLLHRYTVGQQMQVFVAGMRYYRGHTTRKQGDASDGSDASFHFLNPENLERFDYSFPSNNFSAFFEHVVRLSGRLTLTPGLRFEHIATGSEGQYRQLTTDLAGNTLLDTTIQENLENARQFALLGLGVSYKLSPQLELIGNISQNYRAINFNDLRVTNPSFRVDPDLIDERGFSADIGIRGNPTKWLNLDLGVYGLFYQDRIGQVLQTDSVTQRLFRLRTNVADSRTVGIELFAEADLIAAMSSRAHLSSFSVFVNFAWTDAIYLRAKEPAVAGREVEQVSPVTLRSGMAWSYRGFRATLQGHYIHRQYTDATNAEQTATGIAGIIPSYFVTDFSAAYNWKKLSLEAGVTNLLNASYFTRRATGYPGPGIIPADGRSWFVTFGLDL